MKISLMDRWNDNGCVYTELRINPGEACCIKETESGYTYVLECADGNDVYSYVGGSDWPLRRLTNEERAKIIQFVKEIKDERTLD